MLLIYKLVTFLALLIVPCSAQLSGIVGPTTSTEYKLSLGVCNVLDYGAKANKVTDIGVPLAKAFKACKYGGVGMCRLTQTLWKLMRKVWIPPGDYAMLSWQTLEDGSHFAIQLDGTIYRTGTAGGHMIIVENAFDFEFFSHNSQGAVQGYGYQFHSKNLTGPRLIRLVNCTHWSFHDLRLVDSPAFHLVVDGCYNGEIYNMIIRGGNLGGSDGIDVSGKDVWIHDIEITNRDECVTVKSPSFHMLIENVYCNWSGGCAIGSLGSNTEVAYIQYRNIYTWRSNQMMMIKSNGGSGYVRNSSFMNFIGHSNAYCLDINTQWPEKSLDPGNGVVLSNLTFSDWQGTAVLAWRPPINILCPDKVPCTDVSLSHLAFWTDTNQAMTYNCTSAYGSGYCLESGTGGAYWNQQNIKIAPSGFNGAKMPNDLEIGFGTTSVIPIPSIPTSFFPRAMPYKALLNGSGWGAKMKRRYENTPTNI